MIYTVVLRVERTARTSVGRRLSQTSVLAAIVAALSTTCYALGGEVVVGFEGTTGADGIPRPWIAKTRVGKAQMSVATKDGVPGTNVLRLQGKAASFSVDRKVDVMVSPNSEVRWSWKADVLPEGGDVRDARKNDQVLQVFMYFKGGKAISYVWDTTAPLDTTMDESIPLIVDVKVLVIESGMARRGQWVEVSRNVSKDFRRLYGGLAPPIEAVRIQGNCQHTKSDASGYVGPLTFVEAGQEKLP